jgi:hypothetical protein
LISQKNRVNAFPPSYFVFVTFVANIFDVIVLYTSKSHSLFVIYLGRRKKKHKIIIIGMSWCSSLYALNNLSVRGGKNLKIGMGGWQGFISFIFFPFWFFSRSAATLSRQIKYRNGRKGGKK